MQRNGGLLGCTKERQQSLALAKGDGQAPSHFRKVFARPFDYIGQRGMRIIQKQTTALPAITVPEIQKFVLCHGGLL
ncbi:hypothetical protein LMG918_18775 [Xanthomonas euvesicatoria]|nr:hypothetical protein LMG918_18775 [Xanthomonas euvesicatoria]